MSYSGVTFHIQRLSQIVVWPVQETMASYITILNGFATNNILMS